MVRSDGVVTGRICHIRAASKGGPRHDPEQTSKQRDGFENLLLLCSDHHDVIDKNPQEWTTERLIQMKETQKTGTAGQPKDIDDRAVDQIIENCNIYNQGIAIGSIVAGGDVQVAHGDITNNYTAPPSASSWQAEDRQTLSRITDLLGDGVLHYLKDHDFEQPFNNERCAPLEEFLRYHQGSEHEFLNETIEAERIKLRDAVDRFCHEKSARTFSWRKEGWYFIGKIEDRDWGMDEERRRRKQQKIREDAEVLNSAAAAIVDARERLVRVARRELAS